jgi:hypothetical protein
MCVVILSEARRVVSAPDAVAGNLSPLLAGSQGGVADPLHAEVLGCYPFCGVRRKGGGLDSSPYDPRAAWAIWFLFAFEYSPPSVFPL